MSRYPRRVATKEKEKEGTQGAVARFIFSSMRPKFTNMGWVWCFCSLTGRLGTSQTRTNHVGADDPASELLSFSQNGSFATCSH
jgi:hypothetical protein